MTNDQSFPAFSDDGKTDENLLPDFEAEGIDETQDVTVALQSADLTTLSPNEMAEVMALQVDEGHVAFEDIIKLMKLLKTIDLFKKNKVVKAFIEDEAVKYGKDNKRLGMQFTVKKSGTKYDYSVCGHPGLNAALALKKELDTYIKNIQTELRAIPVGETRSVVVEEIPEDVLKMVNCGELATIMPPAVTSGTTCEWKTVNK